MNPLEDALAAMAADVERHVAQTPLSAEYEQTFVAGLTAARRRRTWGTAAAGLGVAAAVVSVALIVTPLLSNSPTPPAASPTPSVQASPGDTLWSTEVVSEVWADLVPWDSAVLVATADGQVWSVDASTGQTEWTVHTGSPVRAAPVVTDSLAMFHTDDGVLWAVDQRGDVLWTTDISSPAPLRDAYSQRSSTPVVVEGTGFVGTADGEVVAVDVASGEIRWRADAGAAVWADLATDGTVVVAGSVSGHVRAFDVGTGDVVLETVVDGGIFTAPAVVDGRIVTGSRGTEVTAVDLATGDRAWSLSMPGGSWAESAVAVDGSALVFGSSAAGTVFSVESSTGDLRWRSHVGGWPWAKPHVSDGVVYMGVLRTSSHQPWSNSVVAMDAQTGQVEWTATTSPALNWAPDGPGHGVASSPVVVGDVLVVAGLDGVVYGFAP